MATNTQIQAPANNNPSESNEDQKPWVLIVDDSRMIRVSIGRILKKEFNIIDAADGEQGWEALLANDAIQVIITDADMPVLNGYDLITRIREHQTPRYQDIPIIMITGAEDDHVREKALKTGATDFIVKPPDKTRLLARVRAYAKADRTSRKLTEEATTDALTQVSSRRYFYQRGMQDLAFAKRHNSDMSIIALTLDNFPELMKTHGNKIAKQILVSVANSLKQTVRTEDTVARVGDYTFALILPNTRQLEAATLCERAKDNIAATEISETNVSIAVTASIGLTSLSQSNIETIKDFLNNAIKRAQIALNAGGNRLIARDEHEAPVIDAVVTEITDINQALALMKSNEKSLIPSLNNIIARIFPLLEFANKTLHWELDQQLAAIKEKLTK
jgi:diguanylate cyclase (GGDEF)-like protein